jgi:uncharacterized repeat protein (TIGR03803 family)
MHTTKVTQKSALAGFASAGKPGYADRPERFCNTTRNQSRSTRSPRRAGLLWFASALAALTITPAHGQTSWPKGANPFAGVVRDLAGNLYGTTTYGGEKFCGFYGTGCGVVYKLDPAGHEKRLYAFMGLADGGTPSYAGVIDSAGNLYGTTSQGGQGVPGSGVVYKLDPAGQETVLYTFTGGSDGANPSFGVVRDSAGNLYGTTGGGGDCCGVVFKIDPSGQYTVLYTFTGGADGGYPGGGVIRDSAGNLYGTTENGGDLSCTAFFSPGCGVVFKVDPSGQETVLYSFTGGADGGFPFVAGVIRDPAGNLYGTTFAGGGSGCNDSGGFGTDGCGVVYKLDTSGQETVLHTFTGGSDGGNPFPGLVRDRAGNLYGTTGGGGDLSCTFYPYAPGCGVVFKVDPSGQETVLYSFRAGL